MIKVRLYGWGTDQTFEVWYPEQAVQLIKEGIREGLRYELTCDEGEDLEAIMEML